MSLHDAVVALSGGGGVGTFVVVEVVGIGVGFLRMLVLGLE